MVRVHGVTAGLQTRARMHDDHPLLLAVSDYYASYFERILADDDDEDDDEDDEDEDDDEDADEEDGNRSSCVLQRWFVWRAGWLSVCRQLMRCVGR